MYLYNYNTCTCACSCICNYHTHTHTRSHHHTHTVTHTHTYTHTHTLTPSHTPGRSLEGLGVRGVDHACQLAAAEVLIVHVAGHILEILHVRPDRGGGGREGGRREGEIFIKIFAILVNCQHLS